LIMFQSTPRMGVTGGDIMAIAADDERVYVGGDVKTVKVIENCDLIKIIRRY